MRTHEIFWKNKLAKQFYKYVFPLTTFSLCTFVAQHSEGDLVPYIQQVELDSGRILQKWNTIYSYLRHKLAGDTWEIKTKQPVKKKKLQSRGDEPVLVMNNNKNVSILPLKE